MRNRKQTEITVETHRLLIVQRRQPGVVSARCEACATEVPMITIEHAATITGRTVRSLLRELELGRIHARETPDGSLQLCLLSLYPSPADQRVV